MDTIKEMISRQSIAKRVEEMADELNADYEGREVVLVCILKGGVIFMADLMRHLKFDLTTEYIELASYSATESTGKMQVLKDLGADLRGKDVLVIEDIVDTGFTLQFLYDHIMAKNPNSVKFCVFLNNPTRRGEGSREPEYVGFVIPNQFVIGYGLDYDGKLRQLPFVASLVRA